MISQHSLIALAVRDGVSIELKVLDATIGLDQTWSPYAQASLTVASENTTDSNGTYNAVLDQTDPFYNTRVQLYVQQAFGSSETLGYLSNLYTGKTLGQVSTIWSGKTLGQLTNLWYVPWNDSVIPNKQRYFDLKVRTSRFDLETGNISLELAGDESLLFDDALVATSPYAPAKLTAKTAVEFALARIGAYLQAGASDAAITADASVWEPGDDSWGYLQSLLDAAQLRLFCDEQRRWYLTNSYETGVTQNVYYGYNYLTLSQEVSLDTDFYSAAVVKYSWTDDANVQQVAYDTYTNGRYNYRKVKRVDYNRRYPGPGAAQAMVNRKDQKTVSRNLQIINDYGYTPGDLIAFHDDVIYPPLASTSPIGSVVGVSWSLPADRMTITAKLSHAPASGGVHPSGGTGSGIGSTNTNMGA